MTGDFIPGECWRTRIRLLLAVAAFAFLLWPAVLSGGLLFDADTVVTGTLSNLHSDKRVVQSGRWFLVREFTIDFAVRNAATYCGELSTTDTTEAHDLMDSAGQPVEVVEKGKDLYLTLKNGRKLKAHRLSPDKCPRS